MNVKIRYSVVQNVFTVNRLSVQTMLIVGMQNVEGKKTT